MTRQEFKTDLLAQPEIDDILFIEAVEKRRDGTEVVYTTEKGETFQKFDVHVVGTTNGMKNSFTVPIGVYNLGTATERVERLREQIVEEKVETQIETYVKTLPFVGVTNLVTDPVKLEARFDAIQVTGANAGKEVKVFAYKAGANPPTYLILS